MLKPENCSNTVYAKKVVAKCQKLLNQPCQKVIVVLKVSKKQPKIQKVIKPPSKGIFTCFETCQKVITERKIFSKSKKVIKTYRKNARKCSKYIKKYS